MDNRNTGHKKLQAEIEELKNQLSEAHDTLDAIRSGEVDAFIVKHNDEHTVYTLKSADHTYRIFVEKMVQGAVTLNKENTILYANSSFAQLMNIPLSKVIGYSFEKFIPEELCDDIKRLIDDAWNGEQKQETMLSNGQRQDIPVLLSMNALELDIGNALSIIITDLSFQKETEQKLKQKNIELEKAQRETRLLNEQLELTVRQRTNELFKTTEHFKFLADNIPAIVWTTTSEGKADYFNERWFEYTGKQNAEEIGDTDDYLLEEDKEKNRLLWKESIITGVPFENVLRIRNRNDEYKWHYLRALPFKNNEDEIIAWFGISTDIDDQKKAMEKKDEFISIVSHELKTPVTSIKGYVQLLQYNFEKEGNSNAAAVLGKVDLQINKLTTLISDLLDVKKIENGQLQYHIEDFDFNILAQEIIEEMSRVLKDHIIEHIFEDCGTVSGDRNKIGQVITNFIDNACKYSPAGSTVYVKTFKKKNSVILSVEDSGIGIPFDQQSKIFDRFFRVTGEKENTFSGLGLGLYISSEIVRRHKGRIWMQSAKDKGSVFYFELPV